MKSKRTSLQVVYILCLLIVGSMTMGCSNDDDANNSNGDLLGTWNLLTYDYDGESVTEFQGTSVVTDFVAEAQNIDATIEFNSNPNIIMSSGSFDIALVFSVLGQEQTQTIPVDDLGSEGTWSRNGNILSINAELVNVSVPAEIINGVSTLVDYTIEELTDTRLRLSTTITETFSLSGADVTTTLNWFLVYTRE